MFRRIVFSSLLVGLIAGVLLSGIQIVAVNPIIFAAESFELPEVEPAPGAHDHGHGDDGHGHHHHDHDDWAPADGVERTFYTVLSNVLAGIGFALVLSALMSQFQHRASVAKGLLWGAGGYIAFYLAPAVGMPPEIPGIEAPPVEYRQLWWMAAVTGVGAGLLVLSFAPVKFKVLSVLLMAAPFLLPIPHAQGPAFAHPDPAAVEQLTALHQQFIWATAGANFAFWVALGVASAWFVSRLVAQPTQNNDNAYA